MKIYCILVDALPYNNSVQQFADNKGIDCIRQFSHCFTKTSIISMITGKLPSELQAGGIGWHTSEQYRKSSVQNSILKETMEWPWINKSITTEFLKNNWSVNIHNGNFFNQVITNNPSFKRTTAFIGGLEQEAKLNWSKGDFILMNHPDYHLYLKQERDHIIKIQSDKSDKNSFHLIMLHQYHHALSERKDKQTAENSIYNILNLWDFDEKDCLFYIFSDHGDFTTCGKYPSLEMYYTWAFLRDTTENTISAPKHLFIGDFYNMCMNKIYNQTNKTTEEIMNDRDRVYYMEDSRASVDLYRSTFFLASQFYDWKNNQPQTLKQCSYFAPSREYVGTTIDLVSGSKVNAEHNNLKNKLKLKFNLENNR